jgi:hypothetical protein
MLELLSTHTDDAVIEPKQPKKVDGYETDDDIMERLRARFSILEEMTQAVKKGHIRSLIVSGPPGVGKSFGVEHVLGKYETFATLANDPSLKKYDIIKGSITALGLYAKLYEYSSEKSILVFDDIDSIFHDEVALNLLKGALDSSKTRRISWLSDARMLKTEGIPKTFDFKGGIVFITNLNFDHIKSEKLKPHIAALESRSLYLDLTINTTRDKMLRIRQITNDGMLNDYDFTIAEKEDILNYIDQHKDSFKELSLRTVIKAADICKSFPYYWKNMADVTIARRKV